MSSDTKDRLMRALLAFVIALLILLFVARERTEFLGVTWQFTSDTARLLWRVFAGVLFAVGIFLVLFQLFRPELSGLYYRASFTSEIPSNEEVQKLVVMLGDLSGNDRVTTIKRIKTSLPKNMSGTDAISILESLDGHNRQKAIEILASRISSDISAQDVEGILRGLSGNERKRAIEALHPDSFNRWF